MVETPFHAAKHFLAEHREMPLCEAWGKSVKGKAMLELLTDTALSERAGWPNMRGVVGILEAFAKHIFERLARIPNLTDIIREAQVYLAKFIASGDEAAYKDLVERFYSQVWDQMHVKTEAGYNAQLAACLVLKCASTDQMAWRSGTDCLDEPLHAIAEVLLYAVQPYRGQEEIAKRFLGRIRISRPTGFESAVLDLIGGSVYCEISNRSRAAWDREEARLSEIIREHFPSSAIPANDANLLAPALPEPKRRRYAELPSDTQYVRVWVFRHDAEFSRDIKSRNITIAMVNPAIQADRSLMEVPNLQRRDYLSLEYEELRQMPGIRVIQEECVPWHVRREWDIKYLTPFSYANTVEGYEVPLPYLKGKYYFAVNGQ